MTEFYDVIKMMKNQSQESVRKVLSNLSSLELDEIIKSPYIRARDNQLTPAGNWVFWLLLAGRGWGKTQTGAWFVIEEARKFPMRIALVGADSGDVRKTMVYGQSGIIASSPSSFTPTYNHANKELTFPNGSVAQCFSAEEKESIRGFQFHSGWLDELAVWPYQETFDNFMMALRLPREDGKNPRVCITTTPKPIDVIRTMVKDPDTHLTTGTTLENRANLSPKTIEFLLRRYSNTRIGEQELNGVILDEAGSLWSESMITKSDFDFDDMEQCVIAVDPAVTSNKRSDETGIVVCGKRGDYYYILEDRSGKYSPDEWSQIAIQLYKRYRANAIVVERNNGGDLVAKIIRDKSLDVYVKEVYATKGKATRAEPIVALYERGLVIHAFGFNELEKQMISFGASSGSKDDRVDALVWGITYLSEKSEDFYFL